MQLRKDCAEVDIKDLVGVHTLVMLSVLVSVLEHLNMLPPQTQWIVVLMSGYDSLIFFKLPYQSVILNHSVLNTNVRSG